MLHHCMYDARVNCPPGVVLICLGGLFFFLVISPLMSFQIVCFYLPILSYPILFLSHHDEIVKNVHQQVWVFLGSATIVAVSAYPVFSKDLKPGHDIFSSEKPEVIREAQESKRKEYRQQIKERRAKLAQDKAEAEAYAATQSPSGSK